VDVLSEVLAAVRLDGAFYIDAEFTAPWCVATKYGLHVASGRLPAADHNIVFFHLLTEGQCWARLASGSEPVLAVAGDLLLFPNDHLHILGSDPTLPPADASEPVVPDPAEPMVRMRFGGGGEPTKFVCGYLACDRRMVRPLLDSFPDMLRIPLGDVSGNGWLAELLRLGVQESLAQRPGARTLLSKLSELAFIEAVRRYMHTRPANQKGWLAGLRDPYIGRALALMHEAPSRWRRVDELAREVALSRSALAERFSDLIGEPPMQYLKRWRLAIAARALRYGTEPMARIAEDAGYDSEAAFTRAFKRELGMPPGAWRKIGDSGSAVPAAERSVAE
jgi:AraC-like DNA-binding protein